MADRGRANRQATAEPPGGRPPSGPELTVRVDFVSGWLTATGRLYGRTAHLLHDAVSALLGSQSGRWGFDVRGLSVADHAGLRALVGAYLRALRHGRRLTLYGASPAVRNALARLRLDRHLLPGDDDTQPSRVVEP
ncbi:STAS domain-containing protein [Blastococcus sp. SYSU D00922]